MDEIRETVYEHIGGNDTFTVTAAERWSIGLIKRLKEKHPDDVEILNENEDGSLVAHLPLSWMRIVPKHNKNLTDEQRKAIAERFKASRG